jgi:integrase
VSVVRFRPWAPFPPLEAVLFVACFTPALRLLSGGCTLLFPGVRSSSRPISDNTLNAALRRLGYAKDEATAHGFRASASSLFNESGRWHPDAIERQLGHLEGNDVRAAYARGEYWNERVSMMQWWADNLDGLRRANLQVMETLGTSAHEHA